MNRLTFSTDANQTVDGFGAYHDLYAPVADVVRLGDRFSVQVEAHRAGDLLLFDRRLKGVRHVRPPKRVARNGYDHFTVQLALGGVFRVTTEAGLREVAPGGLALIDMDQSMSTDALDANVLTLSVPRPLIEAASSRMDLLHGAVLSPARCALLRDFLVSFLRHESGQAVRDSARLGRVVTDLLALALENQTPDDSEELSGALDAACRQQARRYIDRNLDAQPEDIARAIGRSRSALYRAFEPHGGVAKYVQMRRLARLRASLADPRETRSIGQLAALCGFANDSHSSRAFRGAYGLSPSDYRANRRRSAADQAPNVDATRMLERWWSALR